MSSPPYTVTKLVRWRVKDWVSCFNACKLPLEEEEESEKNNPETTGESRETEIVKSKVGSDHRKAKKEEAESSSRKRIIVEKMKEIGEAASSSRLPSFADDDYIVFCFKDDGEVHVVPEKKANFVGTSSDPSRLNLQLLRLEDEAARNEKDSYGKGKGKEPAICTNNEIQEITEIVEEEEEEEEAREGEGIEISLASSDSNDQSDSASTSSFAFPIIQGEWIGSPVQMPRTQVQKPKNTRIQYCCRF